MSSNSDPGALGAPPRIAVADLTMAHGSFIIQSDLSFTISAGEIFVIMGGSGSGRSTLLNHMVGLRSPAKGDVLYDGRSFWHAEPEEQDRLRRRLGVAYQAGALWSSMTLAENVALPLEAFTTLSRPQIREGCHAGRGARRGNVIDARRRGDDGAFARLVDQDHPSPRRIAGLDVANRTVADEVHSA
jgi:ABC-type sugar transport system ATPase subunit